MTSTSVGLSIQLTLEIIQMAKFTAFFLKIWKYCVICAIRLQNWCIYATWFLNIFFQLSKHPFRFVMQNRTISFQLEKAIFPHIFECLIGLKLILVQKSFLKCDLFWYQNFRRDLQIIVNCKPIMINNNACGYT